MISTTLVSAVPVPTPTPVASNDNPASFLTAPNAVKSVVPRDKIVYDCPMTKFPAVTGTISGLKIPLRPVNVKFLILVASLT